MRITPILASNFVSDGGAMFGLVPKPLWSRLITPDENNAIPQNANCLLVELPDGRRGLVETGCGPADKFTEKERRINGLGNGWPLVDALRRLALEPRDMDFIVLTHLHWDHAGGATTGRSGTADELTFPGATHYVHTLEWQAATSGDPLLYQSYPPELVDCLNNLEPSALVTVAEDDRELLPGLRLVRSGGHTRGHSVVVIESPDLELNHPGAATFSEVKKLYYAADLCPTRHHLRMVYQAAYDTYPLETRAWKRQNLPRIARENSLLMFDHDPDAFGATIRPDERKEFVVEQMLPVV